MNQGVRLARSKAKRYLAAALAVENDVRSHGLHDIHVDLILVGAVVDIILQAGESAAFHTMDRQGLAMLRVAPSKALARLRPLGPHAHLSAATMAVDFHEEDLREEVAAIAAAVRKSSATRAGLDAVLEELHLRVVGDELLQVLDGLDTFILSIRGELKEVDGLFAFDGLEILEVLVISLHSPMLQRIHSTAISVALVIAVECSIQILSSCQACEDRSGQKLQHGHSDFAKFQCGRCWHQGERLEAKMTARL